jgi:hypothetical protein
MGTDPPQAHPAPAHATATHQQTDSVDSPSATPLPTFATLATPQARPHGTRRALAMTFTIVPPIGALLTATIRRLESERSALESSPLTGVNI